MQGAWVGGCGCEAYKGMFVFVESEALFVVVPPQGLCNAPHDSGLCWKQFMMCLEDTYGTTKANANG